MNSLDTKAVETLPSTSPITIRRLKSQEIHTLWDLVNYFPSRYENYSLFSDIKSVQEGEKVTVKGTVKATKNEYTRRRGFTIQKAYIEDTTGQIEIVWYNQPYILRNMKIGDTIAAAGTVKRFGRQMSIPAESYECITALDKELVHVGRLVPVYPEKNGLSSRLLREKIYTILNTNGMSLPEFLPDDSIKRNDFLDETIAYKQIHFPDTLESAKKARERLAFDEIFIIQVASYLIRKEWEKENVGYPFNVGDEHVRPLQKFIETLPFALTSAQKRCIDEIITDLGKSRPMNRLLQGDVGSGKTVVAAAAGYLSYLNGFKTILMAPTEILAQQHFKTLSELFKGIKLPKIALYTSASKPKKENLHKADIIVGTHALITKNALFDKVGLIVVDEQHKFGVAQRAELKQKGLHPHLLTMTATPIPRTVALTLYGELDFSLLDEMPPGRRTVKTYVVPKTKRLAAYDWIKKQVRQHTSRAFLVCPLIEESQIETLQAVKAAKKEFEYLKNSIFKNQNLGLLHGKMKSKDKDTVMYNFSVGKMDILVTTPVVEVGVDIPSATIILIEAAERFGLSQLHQLRGRVGRGGKQSHCLLFTEHEEPHILKRLHFFSKTTSGFTLAEYDLKHRGAGDLYGTRQHGEVDLKIARFSDSELIEKSQQEVTHLFAHYDLNKLPHLQNRIKKYKIEVISRD